jgi:hemolysin III
MDVGTRRVGHPGRGEAIANSLTHGIGALLAVAGLVVLAVAASRQGSTATLVGCVVFGAALVLLYTSSTLYHSLGHVHARAGTVLRALDHSAIFLLIAGTYTPFTLGVLQGGWGWTLFGLVWGLAAFGVLVKAFAGIRWHGLSTALYVGMGWLALIAAKPLWESLPLAGLAWLLAGGVAYTAGVYFYAKKTLRFGHFVWHLFVVAGTACHFVAVWKYAI